MVGVADEAFEETVNLIELYLQLRKTVELNVELLSKFVELVLDHRKHVGPLHLWPGRSGRTDWPLDTNLAPSAAWAS